MDTSNGIKKSHKLSPHDLDVLERVLNTTLPGATFPEPELSDLQDADEENNPHIAQSKQLELEAVQAAEKQHFEQALSLFNEAIALTPERASCYNNRAQMWQLQHNISNALSDLDKALELCHGHGKVAAQAYTQRGVIRRYQGDNDLALKDLKQAVSLGNAFAKQLVVTMNPYAALCNQVMIEMIKKVKAGDM